VCASSRTSRERGRSPGETPVVLRVFVAPQRVRRIEVLVGHRTALGEVGADGAELRFEVARADPGHDPSTGPDVQRRHFLREHDRIALRKDHDRQPETRRSDGQFATLWGLGRTCGEAGMDSEVSIGDEPRPVTETDGGWHGARV